MFMVVYSVHILEGQTPSLNNYRKSINTRGKIITEINYSYQNSEEASKVTANRKIKTFMDKRLFPIKTEEVVHNIVMVEKITNEGV